MVTLYCRADEEKVQRLLASGLQAPALVHETLQDFQAVWLQRRRPAAEGGKCLVSVKLDCDVTELAAYDGSPAEKPQSEWLIPVSLIHSHGQVRVSRPRA
ncbi:MAG: hypothetical protein ACYCW6_25590 [Candidatus Xenobia bacterium]